MSYCTQQDLIDEFTQAELVQLTDTTGLGDIDATAVAKAIARADDAISRRLGAVTTAVNLKGLACDIARYYLYADAVTDIVKARFYDALKEIDRIAAAELSALDSGGNTLSGGDLIEFGGSDSVFGRDAY